MRKLGLALIGCLLMACGDDASDMQLKEEALHSSRRLGELEGYESINGLFQTRILDRTDPGTAKFAIEEIAGPGIFEVRALLGYYDLNGDVSEFRAGEPNPFSVMLWYNQLALVAQEIGRNCESPSKDRGRISLKATEGENVFVLQKRLIEMLPGLCDGKESQDELKKSLQNLWLLVVRYDAPFAEREAWLTQALGNAEAKPSQRVAELFETMFLNPYFLLRE